MGLVAGGVLAGSELIHAAKIRKQGKQYEEYTLAYSTFRLKYNCLPGDCSNATQFLASGINGNGNQRIDNNAASSYDNGAATWPASNEYQYFFIMLSQAGLVSGAYTSTAVAPIIGTNMPALALNRNAGFFAGDAQGFNATRNPMTTSYTKGNNWLWAVACDTSVTTIQSFDDNCGVFLADDLRQLDDKFDDGRPLGGKIMAFGGYNSKNNCLNGTDLYDLSHKAPQCQAAFQID